MAGKLRKVAGTVAGAATGAAAFAAPVVAGVNNVIHDINHVYGQGAGYAHAGWDANMASLPAIIGTGGAVIGGMIGHHLANKKNRNLSSQFKK